MRNVVSLFVVVLGAIGSLLGQVDNEFWFVAPEVISTHEDAPIRMRLATFDLPAEVELTMPANPGFAPIQVSIPAGGASTLDLTPFLNELENMPFDEVHNKGLFLQSTTNISAYYEVGQTFNTDIFALKGENALGISFHLPFQSFANNSYGASPSGFDVVATEANTVLTITPSQDLVGHPAGVPYQITLPEAGSTYSARAAGTAAGAHPVGTTVTADKPVAVTLHDDSANSSFFGVCSDLMGDQLVPDHLLGKEHIVVAGYLSPHDRLQILATEDGTNVFVDGAQVATLQEGESHEHIFNTPSAFIQTTEPVAIWQSTGFGCEFGGAQLPHVECTGSSSAVFVRSTGEAMRFNIIVPAGGEDDFLFNGQAGVLNVPGTEFFDVPGNPDWKFAQITTLEGQIPVGEATRIENTTSAFHMGIINGGANTGTRYGYFTDYGALKYQAINQTLNPCLGDAVTIEVNPIENGLYEWTGPNGFTSTGLTLDLGVVELADSGTYVVQGFTGDCPIENDTIEVVLHIPAAPPVVSEDVTECLGTDVVLEADNENVVWTGPNGFEASGNTVELIDPTIAESGTYTATVDNPHCPPAASSVQVDIVESFSYEVLNDEIDVCVGFPLSLAVEPVANGLYQWTGPNDFEASGTDVGIEEAMLFDSGVYVVQGFSGACDIESDTVTVVVHSPLPAPVLSEDVTVCEGFSLTVGADNANVIWTGPNGDSHEGQFWVISDITLEDAGAYTAAAADPFCAPATSLMNVQVVTESDLTMDWTAEYELCLGEELVLTLPGDVVASDPSIQWSWMADGASEFVPVSDQVEFTVTDAGTYLAETSVQTPCLVVSEGVVEVAPLVCALFIPNVITPGNDNLNNRFVIPNLGSYDRSSIQIFNRWGNKVFSHDDFGSTTGWLPDDSFSAGVYYYILNVNRDNEPLTIRNEAGTTTYTEPGNVEVHGTLTVIK